MGLDLQSSNCNEEGQRSEEHTSELQSQSNLVCRLLLEKKKTRLLALSSTLGATALEAVQERLATDVTASLADRLPRLNPYPHPAEHLAPLELSACRRST